MKIEIGKTYGFADGGTALIVGKSIGVISDARKERFFWAKLTAPGLSRNGLEAAFDAEGKSVTNPVWKIPDLVVEVHISANAKKPILHIEQPKVAPKAIEEDLVIEEEL